MAEYVNQGLATEELQGELRDLLCLAVLGDHVRWVVRDDEAGDLVDWLARATVQWRAWADHVAKHLVTLGVAPDARVRSLAKDISVNWVPEGWLRPDEARRLLAFRLAIAAASACHGGRTPQPRTLCACSMPCAPAWKRRHAGDAR